MNYQTRIQVFLVLLLLFTTFVSIDGVIVPVVAVGGLITGIIGTVLSTLGVGVQVGVVLAGKVAEREMMKMNNTGMDMAGDMMETTGGAPEGGSYAPQAAPNHWNWYRFRGNSRNRRSTTNDTFQDILETKLKVEIFTDNLYKSDRSQCVEKLICNIYHKSFTSGLLSDIEDSILNLVEGNMNHGPTYKKMLIAKTVGQKGDDCDFLFSSCPLQASQMVKFIDYSAKRFKI